MSSPQSNTNQQLKALLRKSNDNLQRTMKNVLGQVQDKMEKDMASMKEQHRIELLALQDQQGSPNYSTCREKTTSHTYTRRFSWRVTQTSIVPGSTMHESRGHKQHQPFKKVSYSLINRTIKANH